MINKNLVVELKNPIHLASLGLGSGLASRAPGTWGTLAALPFAWLLSLLNVEWRLSLIIIAFAFGIWCCDQTAKKLKMKDPSCIVWDEFVGLWITLALVPWERAWPLLGFVLFRIFDVFKPWPISVFDKKVTGGLGIMLDDVIAGVFAAAVLQLIIFYS